MSWDVSFVISKNETRTCAGKRRKGTRKPRNRRKNPKDNWPAEKIANQSQRCRACKKPTCVIVFNKRIRMSSWDIPFVIGQLTALHRLKVPRDVAYIIVQMAQTPNRVVLDDGSTSHKRCLKKLQ